MLTWNGEDSTTRLQELLVALGTDPHQYIMFKLLEGDSQLRLMGYHSTGFKTIANEGFKIIANYGYGANWVLQANDDRDALTKHVRTIRRLLGLNTSLLY